MMMMMMMIWFWRRVDFSVNASVSENILSPSAGMSLPFLYLFINPSTSSITTSALKVEAVCSSEKLASCDESIRRQNPEVVITIA
jgi:hypothetical protein